MLIINEASLNFYVLGSGHVLCHRINLLAMQWRKVLLFVISPNTRFEVVYGDFVRNCTSSFL